MRVLITNLQFSGRSGAELYAYELAVALMRQGHLPTVYSPFLGPLAQELRSRSGPVVDDLGQIREAPDVIHGSHNLPTLTALVRFPGVPAINVCHDCDAWHDRPVVHPRVLRYVAVDDACRERLVQMEGIPAESVEVVHNGVDLDKFAPRAPLPSRPCRALLISNYADDRTWRVLKDACAAQQIELDAVGRKLGGTAPAPEGLLRGYDVVFAKGRTAWEALAVGAAVVVCDAHLLGSMVRSDNLAALQRWNFGRRILQTPLAAEAVANELQRYDPADASRVSAAVRRDADLHVTTQQLLELYDDIVAEHSAQATDPVAEAACTADMLQWFAQRQRQLATELATRRSVGETIQRMIRSATRRWRLRRCEQPAPSSSAAQSVLGKPCPS